MPTSIKSSITAVATAILLTSACSIVDHKVVDEFQTGRSELLRGDADGALLYFQRVAEASPRYVNDSNMLGESIWTYLGRAYYAQGEYSEAGEAFAKALEQNKNDTMARLYHGLILVRSSQVSADDRPLSLDNIVYALKERASSERLATLVKEKGIDFQLTPDAESSIRDAGADDKLLEMIRRTSLENENSPRQKLRKQGFDEIRRSLTTIDKWLVYLHENPRNKYFDGEKKISTRVKATLAMLPSGTVEQRELISNTEWVGRVLEEEADLAKRDEQGRSNRPRG